MKIMALIGALGAVSKNCKNRIKNIDVILKVRVIQMTEILSTDRILRRVFLFESHTEELYEAFSDVLFPEFK